MPDHRTTDVHFTTLQTPQMHHALRDWLTPLSPGVHNKRRWLQTYMID